jgi:glycosyltransferase involved in cell wall biosynthesis
MIVHLYEPPCEQKAGGLDQAIRSLRKYLVAAGNQVQVNPKPGRHSPPPDVIHLHGLWQPQFLKVSRSCRHRALPYIVSPHGMLEPWAWRHKWWKKLPYYCLFEKSMLRNAASVLATSDQEARNLSRFIPASQIAVIPLPVHDERGPAHEEARRKLGWSPDELVFLFLSRIHRKKGLELLLKALCACAAMLPAKWRLVIVGDGEESYLSKCRGCASSNEQVFRRTEWKGPIWGDAKWDYLQGADLFCLPSFSENFGLAILEACQVGTPVLTTRNTPWTFLQEWDAAQLVDPEVESVKEGLLAFLKRKIWSKADRDDLARRIHDRFDWHNVGREYVRLYERLAFSSIASPGHQQTNKCLDAKAD